MAEQWSPFKQAGRYAVAGRPEKPVSGTGPLCEFARDLRALRSAAKLTYDELASKAHYSKSALHEAARGRQLPSLDLTLAFAMACGADEETWRARWYQVQAVICPAEVEEPDPPVRLDSNPSATSRRPVWWLAAGIAAVGLAVAGWVVATQPSASDAVSQRSSDPAPTSWRSLSEAPPSLGAPDDAMDPIRTGCASPDVAAQVITLDEVPVRLPSGMDFGVLRLRHMSKCQASWGLVVGPHGPQRRVRIIAHRAADQVAAPSEFAGSSSESYGNLLRTTSGCVYVEAYVETPEGDGPVARTRCA
jgi:transcriptional regulator with XRE-family HTH domain